MYRCCSCDDKETVVTLHFGCILFSLAPPPPCIFLSASGIRFDFYDLDALKEETTSEFKWSLFDTQNHLADKIIRVLYNAPRFEQDILNESRRRNGESVHL